MPPPQETTTRIRLLSPNVINKIAAGEVVDRPASVLKELIENALDAGARRLDLQLDNGGRKRICVADDGSGMDHDDALLAIERHATSKIRDVDDIEHIHTLGFRGEALAATAAVSRFQLKTALGDGCPGVEVNLSGGILRDVRPIGFPCGTTVDVRDLFFNVPARRKFLRAPATELAHARQVVIVHALAHPDIGYTLRADGKLLLNLAGDETLKQRIHSLFGADLPKMLRPVDFTASNIRVHGFTGIPPEGYRSRDHQFIFVNGRPAGAALIGYAIRESYQTLLPRDRHPPLVLFIETDPAQVDVNVHPQKREVRFREPAQVRDAIQQAIAAALQVSGHTERGDDWATWPVFTAPRPKRDEPPTLPSAPILEFDYPAASAGPPPAADGAACAPVNNTEPPDTASLPTADPDSGLPPPSAPWQRVRVVGQVGGLYVILETDDGLVIMDPHAAHERVLFDRYQRAVQAGRAASQDLLIPVTVTLAPLDTAALQPHLQELRALGFGIHEFGVDGFMIDAVPTGFEQISPQEWVAELVANFKRDGGSRRLPRGPRDDMVARAACHAAVKARQRLSTAEIEQLVGDLAATDMPYTCPHGRPILIHLSFADLRQRFGR